MRGSGGPRFLVATAGETIKGMARADGFWAMLPPPGEHTVRFVMSAPSLGFSQDNPYHLPVVKGKRAP